MRFQIRDLIWFMAFAGLVIARFLDQAATRLRDVEWRADTAERHRDEDGRRDDEVDRALATLITDVGALQGKWPPRAKGGK